MGDGGDGVTRLVVVWVEEVMDEEMALGLLRGVTPQLSFQPTGSVQDYGATESSSGWQRLS